MIRQSVLVAASNFGAQLIVSVLYIFAARESSPDAFGKVVTAIVLANYVASLMDFGVNSLWTRELARDAVSVKTIAARIRGKIFASVAISLVVLSIAVAARDMSSLWITASLSIGIVLSQAMQVPLRAAGKAHRAAFAIVSDRISAAVAWILLSSIAASPANLGFALIIGSLISAGFSYFASPAHIRLPVRFVGVSFPWRGARSYGLGSIAIGAQSLDQPLLTLVAGPLAGGLYGAVNRWTQPMGVVASAYAQVGISHVATKASLGEAVKHLGRSFWILAAAVTGCLIVAVASPVIVKFLLGPSYEGSQMLLTVVALATVPAVINQPLYIFLQALGREAECGQVIVFGVICQLISCYIMSFAWGAMGAATALAFGQIVILTGLILIGQTKELHRSGRRYRS